MPFDREREMFDAKCADCGNDCQIPFKPTEDRPVYCSKSINQHNVVVAMVEDQVAMVEDQVAMVEDQVAMVEDQVAMVEDQVAMVEMTEVPDLVEETTDQERCLMQNAEIVGMIAKYHSNQKKTDLFIAMNVSKITDVSKLF